MTPEAITILKAMHFPQRYCVCVAVAEFDAYEVGAACIDASTFCGQVVADLRDYATGGRSDWGVPEIGGYVMKRGRVTSIINAATGRKLAREYDWLVQHLNIELARQQPPVIAVSSDGRRVKMIDDEQLRKRLMLVPGFLLERRANELRQEYFRRFGERSPFDIEAPQVEISNFMLTMQ